MIYSGTIRVSMHLVTKIAIYKTKVLKQSTKLTKMWKRLRKAYFDTYKPTTFVILVNDPLKQYSGLTF